MDSPPAGMEEPLKLAKSGCKGHFSPLSGAPEGASQAGLCNPIGTNIWNKNAPCKKSGFFILKKSAIPPTFFPRT
jgi:hypothetical protein